jgi:hypothetical protein
MKEKPVDLQGKNDKVDIPGDKHDISKRDSCVTDVNAHVSEALDAGAVQGAIDSVKNTLLNNPRDMLNKLWRAK